MSKIVQEIDRQTIEKSLIRKDAEGKTKTLEIPDFKPGDTVVVQVKVVEGDRERVQA